MLKTDAWLRDVGAQKSFDKARTLAKIDLARRQGFLSGKHSTCRSTEIIAYAVKGPASSPLALSVHIPSCLSIESKEDVRLLLEARVSESRTRMSQHPEFLPSLEFGGEFSPIVRDRIAPQAFRSHNTRRDN